MHRVYFISLFLFLATCSIPSVAQEIAPKNQIELQHDNDFILLTDRYYSSGLYLTYRRRLDRGIFGTDQEQLDFQLQYLAFTPDNVEAFDPASFDRTYAGFLGLESSWTHTQVTSMFRFSLLTGLVGPSSSAGSFQRWYHENIVLFKVPTWAAELENQFHVNASFTYAKEWQWNPNPFGVYFAFQPTLTLGTKDIFAQPEAVLYLGRRNPLNSSFAYQQINSTEREIFVAFRASYRLVLRNALLEGTLTNGNNFDSDLKNGVLILGADFKHRSGKNYYTVGYRHNSQETTQINDHQFIVLAYGRSF